MAGATQGWGRGWRVPLSKDGRFRGSTSLGGSEEAQLFRREEEEEEGRVWRSP